VQVILPIMTLTGVPEFDYFFSLSFFIGMICFVAAAPLRLYMNRYF
jgi:hypothetical protein